MKLVIEVEAETKALCLKGVKSVLDDERVAVRETENGKGGYYPLEPGDSVESSRTSLKTGKTEYATKATLAE